MDDCILWEGPQTPDGYGIAEVGDLFNDGRRHRTLAHRAKWMRERGPLAPGVDLHHVVCGVRLCVNLDHVEPLLHGHHSRITNASITACPRGHPYTEENTYRDPKRGWRQCRVCWRVRRKRG